MNMIANKCYFGRRHFIYVTNMEGVLFWSLFRVGYLSVYERLLNTCVSDLIVSCNFIASM